MNIMANWEVRCPKSQTTRLRALERETTIAIDTVRMFIETSALGYTIPRTQQRWLG